MAIEQVNDTSQPGISLDPSKRTDADRQEIKRLAQEFEAMLMTQMLREMRRSMLDDDEEKENGFGADAMTDTGDVELGRALSRVGGIGLTDTLLKAFERQIVERTGTTSEAGKADRAGLIEGEASKAGEAGRTGKTEAGQADGEAAIASPLQNLSGLPISLMEMTAGAPLSSKFGWRQDPFTGAAQFHHGLDIAMAYGHDVKAAAEGTVSFAGVQQGYGNTVVIDHDGGRQTRYAHLSEEFVRAGDIVTEGQVLGKSGNSGRSTGPHLHFEMLVNGRPVDPTTVAE
jgi:murein DD-endopeptidase MepM/ murein hydrolase activator NlpD